MIHFAVTFRWISNGRYGESESQQLCTEKTSNVLNNFNFQTKIFDFSFTANDMLELREFCEFLEVKVFNIFYRLNNRFQANIKQGGFVFVYDISDTFKEFVSTYFDGVKHKKPFSLGYF